jgi:hypothetical protein
VLRLQDVVDVSIGDSVIVGFWGKVVHKLLVGFSQKAKNLMKSD